MVVFNLGFNCCNLVNIFVPEMCTICETSLRLAAFLFFFTNGVFLLLVLDFACEMSLQGWCVVRHNIYCFQTFKQEYVGNILLRTKRILSVALVSCCERDEIEYIERGAFRPMTLSKGLFVL